MSDAASDLKGLIAQVADGATLSADDARRAFEIIMSGDATPSQMGGFLMALRVRGETIDEIVGAATTMRAKALTLEAPEGAIDTCGTGGDAKGTLNISTAAALVVAGAGAPVAKHGNRALSSRSGSADVLAALGVDIEADMGLVKRAMFEANIGFLMAPRHHGAMRNVGPTRVELGTRTIFNLLGPLANPCGAKRQLVGVFAAKWVRPLAEVLGRLGCERAWVVHGADGLDEISISGPTHVAELKDGRVSEFEVGPADVGLPMADIDAIRGGDAQANAGAIKALLAGQESAFRNIVLFNAAAALTIAGKADSLSDAAPLARAAIDNGGARAALDALRAITNGS